MKQRPIAFYVHHHGAGHRMRTDAISEHLQEPPVIITSDPDYQPARDSVEVHTIAPDYGDEPCRYVAESCSSYHFAPVPSDLYRRRTAELVQTLTRINPSLLVVDVSAEVVLQGRLCGIPTLAMRQHGRRDDPAHMAAYNASVKLLAPFPKALEDSITPRSVIDKTLYTSGFSRYTAQSLPERSDARSFLDLTAEDEMVSIIVGKGGHHNRIERLIQLGMDFPEVQWSILGKISGGDQAALPANVHYIGWTESPELYLAASDGVVTSAGHNSVMEAGTLGLPLVVVPEERHFEEQERKARVLKREGLAHILPSWNASRSQWKSALRHIRSFSRDSWQPVFASDGSREAARHIETLAHSMAKRVGLSALNSARS